MNKFIRNVILSLVLVLSIPSPMTIMTTTSYATGEDKKTEGNGDASKNSTITAIDKNVGITASGGEVSISNIDTNTNQVFTSFLGFIRLLSGGGALVMLMFFVINFVKLGASGTNANARAQAISGLVWSGIATVCLSMSLVIFLFFFNMDSVINQTTPNGTEGDGSTEKK